MGGLAALAGSALFVVTVIGLHLVQPGYDPASQLMSELALGSYGWMMLAAFGGLAAAVLGIQAAIALANATSYGLAAYLWTRDLSRAMRVAEALEYGIVGINDGLPTAMAPQAPFGGMKDSGIGREGGPWGLEEYLEVKLVSIGLS